MDIMMQNWLDQTIDEDEKLSEIPRISLTSILFAAIANYRAPAWVQSPAKKM